MQRGIRTLPLDGQKREGVSLKEMGEQVFVACTGDRGELKKGDSFIAQMHSHIDCSSSIRLEARFLADN